MMAERARSRSPRGDLAQAKARIVELEELLGHMMRLSESFVHDYGVLEHVNATVDVVRANNIGMTAFSEEIRAKLESASRANLEGLAAGFYVVRHQMSNGWLRINEGKSIRWVKELIGAIGEHPGRLELFDLVEVFNPATSRTDAEVFGIMRNLVNRRGKLVGEARRTISSLLGFSRFKKSSKSKKASWLQESWGIVISDRRVPSVIQPDQETTRRFAGWICGRVRSSRGGDCDGLEAATREWIDLMGLEIKNDVLVEAILDRVGECELGE